MDRIHVTFRRLNTWAKREFDTFLLLLLYTLDNSDSFVYIQSAKGLTKAIQPQLKWHLKNINYNINYKL